MSHFSFKCIFIISLNKNIKRSPLQGAEGCVNSYNRTEEKTNNWNTQEFFCVLQQCKFQAPMQNVHLKIVSIDFVLHCYSLWTLQNLRSGLTIEKLNSLCENDAVFFSKCVVFIHFSLVYASTSLEDRIVSVLAFLAILYVHCSHSPIPRCTTMMGTAIQ